MLKIVFITFLALIALAGNSVFGRLALATDTIDAASYTNIRLLSGILMLWLLYTGLRLKKNKQSKGSWKAALMLFLYAVTFSYAYAYVDTGTGALILFGAVQITMVIISIINGARLSLVEYAGITLSFCGLIYLMLPQMNTPTLQGFMLMIIGGVSWGVYSLLGKRSVSAIADTTFNFLRTMPFIAILYLITMKNVHLTTEGVLYAVLSGAITSGLGYSLWYFALRDLTTTLAAALQLLVPILATIGGIMFVGESMNLRLMLASIMVLGGIAVILFKDIITTKLKSLSINSDSH